MAWTKSHKRSLGAKLRVLKPFDPYHSPLCTCGPKLTLNVYTGCGYECAYCYTSSYAFGRWGRHSDAWGPKLNVVENLERDLGRISDDAKLRDLLTLPVAVSLSSDPYPATPTVPESELGLTRRCIGLLADAGRAILIQTKSDLVCRDLDVLPAGRTVVGLTITTLDADLAAQLEPYAPPPAQRLDALGCAARRGFATLCRIDPLVPGVNDSAADLEELIRTLADRGVHQVISSTFKMRHDSAARIRRLFPGGAAAMASLYDPVEVAGYRYMTEPDRRRRMELVRRLADAHGLEFSCCREGMPDLNARSCDGQHLI